MVNRAIRIPALLRFRLKRPVFLGLLIGVALWRARLFRFHYHLFWGQRRPYALVQSGVPVDVTVKRMRISDTPGSTADAGLPPSHPPLTDHAGVGIALSDSYNLTGTVSFTDVTVANTFGEALYVNPSRTRAEPSPNRPGLRRRELPCAALRCTDGTDRSAVNWLEPLKSAP